MFFSWLSSATAAGFGAFCGALAAYKFACMKEKERENTEYCCLLLVVYEHLESLYTTFADVTAKAIKESDGTKLVVFDMPLPDLELSPEQMQRLMEIAPDKQMPSTLIKVQHFLKSHGRRVEKSGVNALALDFVRHQTRQLEYMLLSVRMQYEQASGATFPLDEITAKTPPQK